MVLERAQEAIRQVSRFFSRFRHPVSLPEEMASALGVKLSNHWSIQRVIQQIEAPGFCPFRLQRMMPRDEAEAAFALATKKEYFRFSSLFSFYFAKGWVEFSLQFDENGLLRRIYLHHKECQVDTGYELPLAS